MSDRPDNLESTESSTNEPTMSNEFDKISENDRKLADSHPMLKQVVRYLTDGAMDLQKIREFTKWRGGPKHSKLTEDQRALSDKLWRIVNREASTLQERAKAKPNVMPLSATSGQPTQKTDYASAASPSELGSPFYNPYTFIPFGKKPKRRPPTPHSIGEVVGDRMSGVLELEIRTLSPLLSCNPIPHESDRDHKTYRALTIGDDVIVPATGVRGALRTLMTILAGGTLGYVDEFLYLTQGRDTHLGPAGKNSARGTPKNVFLGEVVSVGTAFSPGEIRLGETQLVSAHDLERAKKAAGGHLPRPQPNERVKYIWAEVKGSKGADTKVQVVSLSDDEDEDHQWKVKLSGRPVNTKSKHEGLFRPSATVISIPPRLWADYQGRNRHGDHPELRRGDLVWLEPVSPDCKQITTAKDIKSLQWARWGRTGEHLLTLLKDKHPDMVPDAFRDDGLVDEVTDLFGHIPHRDHPGAAPAFAARIRPENLVFFDAKKKVESVTLAPLLAPHPGCVAFYRDCDDLGDFGDGLPLRGYKVYRNTKERGRSAPWRYETQPIYHEGRLKDKGDPRQKANKTCELLREGETGLLRIAFHDLTRREFALLLCACSVDWRLGGGKPLGLGHCRVTAARMIDEFGNRTELFTRTAASADEYPDPANIGSYAECISDLADRIRLYHESQRPVDKLRYPRASEENRNTVTIGGHVWFGRHASRRKARGVRGLEVIHVAEGSELSRRIGGKKQINPQPLPPLAVNSDTDGRLYGYDLHCSKEDVEKVHQQSFDRNLEPFNFSEHVTQQHKSGGHHSQTQESRKKGKQDRQE